MRINRPSQIWMIRREAMVTLYWIAAIITLASAGQISVDEIGDSEGQIPINDQTEDSGRGGSFGAAAKDTASAAAKDTASAAAKDTASAAASVTYKRKNGQTIQHTVVLDSTKTWYKAQIEYVYRRVSKCSDCKGVLWAGAQRIKKSNDFEWLFDGIGNVGIWRGDHKYKTRTANFCLGLWVQDSKFGEKQCIDNFDKYKASDF
ncbi:hypothetical protein Q1695_013038 [Nippostrongylus brasiliensis]|nr:hypothetical protein Q1695_013038 [Nippostrongylus brasiliensis]